jgi:hypothetical protein
MGDMGNAYIIVDGNPESDFENLDTWEDNMKMDLEKIV